MRNEWNDNIWSMRTNCAHTHSYAHPGATRRAPRLLRFVSFKANSRAEAGALIHSLQTGCLRKKGEEGIETDYNRVEEGRGRK